MEDMVWFYQRNLIPYSVTWSSWSGDIQTDDNYTEALIRRMVLDESRVQVGEVGVFRDASLDDNLRAWGTVSAAVRAVADAGSVQAPPAFISGEDPDEEFTPTKAGKLRFREVQENRRSTGKNAG